MKFVQKVGRFNWAVFTPFGVYLAYRHLWGRFIVSLLLFLWIFSLGGNVKFFDVITWLLLNIWIGAKTPVNLDQPKERFWLIVGVGSLIFSLLYLVLGWGPIQLSGTVVLSSLLPVVFDLELWLTILISTIVALLLLYVIVVRLLRFKASEFFKGALVAFVLVLLLPVPNFLVRTYAAQPFYVSGPAMEPNFSNNDYVLVTQLTKLYVPQRGDVVVFKWPQNQAISFVKRVIAVPGERVEVKNGRVSINGDQLDEPYINNADTPMDGQWELARDQYFVMGDNRANSSDSRVWGPVDRNLIIGKVSAVIYPFEKFQTIE